MSDPVADRVFMTSPLRMAIRCVCVGLLTVIMIPVGALLVLSATAIWRSGPAFAAGLGLLGAVLIGAALLLSMLTWREYRNRRKPVLTLDERGIHFGGRSQKLVPWHLLSAVEITSMRTARILLLTVRDPTLFATSRNWFHGDAIPIAVTQVKGWPSDILAAIRNHPCYRGEGAVRS